MNVHRQASGARVSAIYDLDTARAGQLAEACGGAKAFSDPNELIKDPSVDAVIIASPDPTHAGFVRACLEQRKPVLSEKPLATSATDAKTIIEIEQEIGQRLVSVGLMRRFDPQHVADKQVVDSGEMGRPILVQRRASQRRRVHTSAAWRRSDCQLSDPRSRLGTLVVGSRG